MTTCYRSDAFPSADKYDGPIPVESVEISSRKDDSPYVVVQKPIRARVYPSNTDDHGAVAIHHNVINQIYRWFDVSAWESGNPFPCRDEINKFLEPYRGDLGFSNARLYHFGYVLLCREAIDAVIDTLKKHNMGGILEINAAHNNGCFSWAFHNAGVDVIATAPRPGHRPIRHFPIEEWKAAEAILNYRDRSPQFYHDRAVLLSYSRPSMEFVDKEGLFLPDAKAVNDEGIKVKQNGVEISGISCVGCASKTGMSVLNTLREGNVLIHVDYGFDPDLLYAIKSCSRQIGYDIPLPLEAYGGEVKMRIFEKNGCRPGLPERRGSSKIYYGLCANSNSPIYH